MTETTYRDKKASVLNAAMHIYIPETNLVPYGDYPMLNDRWCRPNEKVPYGPQMGQPCYVKTENKQPVDEEDSKVIDKTGYIWGPGHSGWGYYHLLTVSAWKTLYARVGNRVVTIAGGEDDCCCFGPPQSKSMPMPRPQPGLTRDDMDDLRVLIHGRSTSTKGNDGVARTQQNMDARNTAQGLYIMSEGAALQDVMTINKGLKNNIIKR